MLDEARRRRSRGTDVVVAAINPGFRSPSLPASRGSADRIPRAHDRLDVEAAAEP